MKYIVVVFTLLLTGCSHNPPVVAKFPSAPETLLKSCPKQLNTIEGPAVNIIDLSKSVVKNYETYHLCATKTDSWIEWYTEQKKIFEKATK
jgi:hypothetical protein